MVTENVEFLIQMCYLEKEDVFYCQKCCVPNGIGWNKNAKSSANHVYASVPRIVYVAGDGTVSIGASWVVKI
jgi:hypothetical protein